MTAETHRLVSNRPRCPHHPGRLVDKSPCGAKLADGSLCTYFEPQANVQVQVETSPEPLANSDIQEVPVLASVPNPIAEVDMETGEVYRQPTLDPELFPAAERRQVPMVKLGLSGSIELTQSEWQAYCDQGLEPGRVVKLTITGYLPNPHAKWVKRTETNTDPVTKRKDTSTWWEQEGAIKVKALELGSFELGGFYDGE